MKLLLALFFCITLSAQNDTIVRGVEYKIGNIEIFYIGEYKHVITTLYNDETTIYQKCVYKREETLSI